MTNPYDPRAEALNALAAMRYPDLSEPPAEQVEAMETALRAVYVFGRAVPSLRPFNTSITLGAAYLAAAIGRPMVPPA